jgi:hypothetical protein
MNKNELRKTSSQFRRISSQFLSMESDEEFSYLLDLIDFIDNNAVLIDYVKKCKVQDYDIDKAISEKSTWRPLVLPAGTEQVVSFVYQMLDFFRIYPEKLRGMIFYYSPANSFSEKYQAFARKTVAPFINYLLSYLEICLIDAAEVDHTNNHETKPKIFLSYCSKDAAIADIVDAKLQEMLSPYGIYVSRDERDVMYRESFNAFMKSIEEHDFVVMIVSDSYLKSRPCMYEVLETMKSRKYENKMLFIVLSEDEREYYKDITEDFLVGANVYDISGRIAYSQYWQQVSSNLERLIDEIPDVLNKIEPAKELKTVRKICIDIDEFTSMLADRRGIPFRRMLADNFKPILEVLIS